VKGFYLLLNTEGDRTLLLTTLNMQIRNTPRVFAIEVIAEIFNNKIVISRKRKAEDEADEKEKEIVEKEWKKNFEVSADISKVK